MNNEKRQALYRVHGEDEYGRFTIDCYSKKEYRDALAWCSKDRYCEDIWAECWNSIDGWQEWLI